MQTATFMKNMQKVDAVARLRELGAPKAIIRDFEKRGKVYLCLSPFGVFDELTPAFRKEIKQFEKRYDATVFFVVRDDVHAHHLDSLLYVSRFPEEWRDEHLDISEGHVMTYTINRTVPSCSEFGSIYFNRTNYGGIVRLN